MALDFNNQEWTFRPIRLKYWGKFVYPSHMLGNIIVAGLGVFEKELTKIYHNTLHVVHGDYNKNPHTITPEDAHITAIYCFEVLEHLVDPTALLYLFNRISSNKDCPIYVSFPTRRPMFLWTDGHFHEFQMRRAEKMFEICGFRVVRKTLTPPIRFKWWKHFTGFRPFLRLFWPLRCAIYELRNIKNV